MKESDIKAVASSLAHWNPLGDNSIKIKDLDGYKTEAVDIIAAISFPFVKGTTEEIIERVLLEAFKFPLNESAVKNVAKETDKILKG